MSLDESLSQVYRLPVSFRSGKVTIWIYYLSHGTQQVLAFRLALCPQYPFVRFRRCLLYHLSSMPEKDGLVDCFRVCGTARRS